MPTLRPNLIIFDFDGVVVDSETMANRILAESVSTLGKPTTLDDSIRLFMGKRWEDTKGAIVAWTGAPLPPDFEAWHRARSRGEMRGEAGPNPVAGVVGFLESQAHLPRCVASSSNPEWLDHCVDKHGLRGYFGANLFSATAVANGKPAPDIFLHAAQSMATVPSECLVIEDSPSGVMGARAAGMTVIGFLGASHIRDGHGDRLLAAGAHRLAYDYEDVARLLVRTG